MTHRRLTWLFVALSILHIVPVWSAGLLPTGDGASHLYNAWIMKGLMAGDAPAQIASAYEIDWRPHPNWSGHLILVALMTVVPPLIAEKLFVSGIVLLLLAGAWLLATANGNEGAVYAFLAFPFCWSQSLAAGFYNYALSIGVYLVILAVFWRRRDRTTVANIALIALLLVVCYFTHPLAAGYACGAVILCSLLTRRFAWIAGTIPVIPLLLWFARGEAAGTRDWTTIEWKALRFLGGVEPVMSFDERQRPIAIATAIVFAVLVVYTLVRERRLRPVDAFALLSLGYTIAMLWVPAGHLARILITERSATFVYLTLLAWFTTRLHARLRVALVAVLTIVAVANAVIYIERFRHFSRDVERIAHSLDAIEPGSTFVPLLFAEPRSASYSNLFAHSLSYGALDRRLVDLANYEPATGYFPVRNQRDTLPLDVYTLVNSPGDIDAAQLALRAEYVFTFLMPESAPNYDDLERLYRVIADDGGVRTWQRRDKLFDNRELILLPLTGTATPVGAWEIVQRIRNNGTETVRVLVYDCRNDMPCRYDIAPGATVPVASSGRRAAVLIVRRGIAGQLQITTVAQRADADLPELSVHVPAVHERAFTRRGITIPHVKSGGRKLSLRIYPLGTLAINDITFRLRAGGRVIGTHEVKIPSFGVHENADLGLLFPELPSVAMPIEIEVTSAPDVRVWAFATSTDVEGRAELHLPVAGTGF
ncbi:MAG TPA: hypothetical protein VEK57_04230 [Thermoanaerobaculia bacterium]|nr:hypothetical protein [Thermoanaerobaculia bacterium]